MKQEIIIAGFGGQGVLSLGKILAYSAVMQGNEVTWMPSYGPEMRGGTANVTVIISDELISSPIVHEYDVVVALNQQSLDKFIGMVKKGGMLLFDPNGISHIDKRDDITFYSVEAAEKAAEIGNNRVFNMIVLGALLKITGVVSLESVDSGLKKSLPERVHSTLDANKVAIEIGMNIVNKEEF